MNPPWPGWGQGRAGPAGTFRVTMSLEQLPQSSPGLPAGDEGAGNSVGPKEQGNVQPWVSSEGKRCQRGKEAEKRLLKPLKERWGSKEP